MKIKELLESPAPNEAITWPELMDNVAVALSKPDEIIDLGNGYSKFIRASKITYWKSDRDGKILLGGIIKTTKKYAVIEMVGKNKDIARREPFVIDLYLVMAHDLKKNNQVLISDSLISDGAFKTWTRLFQNNYRISIMNIQNPNGSLIPIKTEKEMIDHYRKGIIFQNLRFVLEI